MLLLYLYSKRVKVPLADGNERRENIEMFKYSEGMDECERGEQNGR